MLLSAMLAPMPAKSTATAMNPAAGCPATAARLKLMTLSNGTAIRQRARFWPEK